ncbi:transcription termination/antitermination protein NusG [Maritimibacter sp. HL-12]|jgi:transcriptional antiterminator RfaH|uniref:transcription termination/antitermination protein NusG n=1 Tax=Maritimibacter sp. HL-12 TaxID=1162418 RepID=UPI000A0F1000|nr:transcription termination/antitermination NusG family protein [Maritimibacter sp. HL-12]SMH55437.1 transcriptional antiterminator RfaH [Maritimibacter sp. HL-12]
MTSASNGRGWYLAQIKPNSHRIAERNLLRQGFEVFLPMTRVTRRQSGRFIESHAPLFPGYIFIAFDPVQSGWRSVNSTLGITRLVNLGGAPATVPDALVENLRARCDAEGVVVPLEDLVEGQEVRLTKGPFAEFVAKVETIEPDRRVWLLIDLMGQATRVSVPQDDVRRL